jgi:hypothetical protein
VVVADAPALDTAAGREEVPVVEGEAIPAMVAAVELLKVMAAEDMEVTVSDTATGEAVAKEVIPLDVPTTLRQQCSKC